MIGHTRERAVQRLIWNNLGRKRSSSMRCMKRAFSPFRTLHHCSVNPFPIAPHLSPGTVNAGCILVPSQRDITQEHPQRCS